MINSFRSPNDTDDTMFETEYEKLVSMPDGTKVCTVKTAEDFADMVAADVAAKEKLDSEKRKRKKKTKKTTAVETDEDSRAVTQTVPQGSLGHLKRKRGPPGRGRE